MTATRYEAKRLIGAILALTYPLNELGTVFITALTPAMEPSAAVDFAAIVRFGILLFIAGAALLVRRLARIPIAETKEPE